MYINENETRNWKGNIIQQKKKTKQKTSLYRMHFVVKVSFFSVLISKWVRMLYTYFHINFTTNKTNIIFLKSQIKKTEIFFKHLVFCVNSVQQRTLAIVA